MFHLDTFLSSFISQYGTLVYVLVFCIIFAETGLFIPILPGDSLIFACGAFSAMGLLNIWISVAICLVSSFFGCSLNYYFGVALGKKLYQSNGIRFIKKDYIDRSTLFYQKHGGKAIILSRFMPVIRSFTPFVAGIGQMQYRRFMVFNIAGVILWTGVAASLGFFFGNIPLVRDNFSNVVLGIILISLLPAVVMYLKDRLAKKHHRQE